MKDLIGKKSDFLTVIAYSEKKNRRHYWLCKCEKFGINKATLTSIINKKTWKYI
jgi:hypothetical protein